MPISLSGVHVPHRKHTANMKAVAIDTPKSVTIPMSMHIGKPAKPVVKMGDHVDVGTLIAEADGFISSPVYASISGKVKKISNILLSNGNMAPAVTIESDGLMTVSSDVQKPTVTSREELVDAVRKSGIVGLGGAGFPTFVKFNVDPARIEELIINGAECEPYITSDSLTMTECTDDIARAIDAFLEYFHIPKVIIGIENNKKEAIAAMRELCKTRPQVSVKVLPSVYPQGGEKVLIYHLTGKQVPLGKLPIDVGSIVVNCTTMAGIGNYLESGMPLVGKCITVDGGAVAEPKNVLVPIGTSLADVFAFCGGFKEEPKKVLYGGPMMGIAVPSLDVPILKNTNAILAFNEKEAKMPKTTACIHCGACTNHCPFGINPAAIETALRKKDTDELEKLGTMLCMECGCCSFVCPAKRPLVHTNKLAKIMLREAKAKEAKS